MTEEEREERRTLWRSCGSVALYPTHYTFFPSLDIYVANDDKHEWHAGSDVRRLFVLNKKFLEETCS